MASQSGEDLSQWDAQSLSSANEEKILVSVRLRPLNEKETARNDVSDWECINNNTIIFKKNIPERSMFPSAYTFDRVFGCESATMQVYKEGAKEVALSVVSGINSSIFAYGQTSSGKTFTMSGITEYAVADIYNHIEQHKEREFVIKFSAIEIYNEAVRDLLSSDSMPLRLLDDPERGTVVEKLIEETPRDWAHLQELISICAAQRQIGETSLNETSSRSHQILRLTIESSAREFLRADNSSTLSASVNFIDLAGSERASQTLSAGARLKEGCHINRSLLTLGTVIRKLSKGRNGHVPYRDSKLTRILQNSLGGNARTAIICTMSPARSHVEQSRNTLLFASCAKEVSTSAQVNVVMTDKALVKHLQRELARMENELQCAGSTLFSPDSAILLREKELQIEKMEQEIKELVQQRDQAQSKINDLLQSVGDDQMLRLTEDSNQLLKSHAQISEEIRTIKLNSDDMLLHILPDNSEEQFLLEGTSPLSTSTPKFPDPDPCKGWEEIAQTQLTFVDSEDVCKDVRCIEIEDPDANKNTTIEDPDTKKNTTIDIISPGTEEKEEKIAVTETVNNNNNSNNKEIDNDETLKIDENPELNIMKQKVLQMQKVINSFMGLYTSVQSPYSPESNVSRVESLKQYRSKSCRAVIVSNGSPLWLEKAENMPPSKDFQPRLVTDSSKDGLRSGKLSRRDSSLTSISSFSMDEKAENVKFSLEGDDVYDQNVAATVDEGAKVQSEKKSDDNLGASECSNDGSLESERQKKEIIEQWDSCNVSLLHRTKFFLFFLVNDDPSDASYIDIERRRLSCLKDRLSTGIKTIDGQILRLPSSLRDLNKERLQLSRLVYKRIPEKDRESLFQKWGISPETKDKRLQLGRRIWTDTKDMDHIQESAALVAKLIGHIEHAQTPKEMVGLSFSHRPLNRRSSSWKHNMSSFF